MSKTCTDVDMALFGDKCYIMYVYRGQLKIKYGYINAYMTFTPLNEGRNPRLMTKLPFSYYGEDWKPIVVYNKYQYGKVLFRTKRSIPKWKEFFKQLYSEKIKFCDARYKKQLWEKFLNTLDCQ